MRQETFISNGKTYLLAQLTESQTLDIDNVGMWCDERGMDGDGIELIAEGSWTLLGLASDMSEEQAAGIVKLGKHPADDSPCYYYYGSHQDYLCANAIGSLSTLISSLSFNPESTLILILND